MTRLSRPPAISLLALAASLCLAAAPRPAQAEFLATLDVQVTPQAGGLSLYEYSLTNPSGSTLPVVQFDLAVDASADLGDILGPAGWSYSYAAGDASISFFSQDASADLAPGTSLVVSFLSLLGPAGLDYALVGSNPPGIRVVTGQVAGPGTLAIPEPASLALLGLGLACCLAARSHRTRASAVS